MGDLFSDGVSRRKGGTTTSTSEDLQQPGTNLDVGARFLFLCFSPDHCRRRLWTEELHRVDLEVLPLGEAQEALPRVRERRTSSATTGRTLQPRTDRKGSTFSVAPPEQVPTIVPALSCVRHTVHGVTREV